MRAAPGCDERRRLLRAAAVPGVLHIGRRARRLGRTLRALVVPVLLSRPKVDAAVLVLLQWMWMLQLLRWRLLWKRLLRMLQSSRDSLIRSNFGRREAHCMLIASLLRRREAHCMQHIRERELISFPKPVPLIEPGTEHAARQVAP